MGKNQPEGSERPHISRGSKHERNKQPLAATKKGRQSLDDEIGKRLRNGQDQAQVIQDLSTGSTKLATRKTVQKHVKAVNEWLLRKKELELIEKDRLLARQIAFLKHSEKLGELIQEWKDQLVFNIPEPLGGYGLRFPTTFTTEDNHGPGIYPPKGSLCWEVKHDRTVDVWFPVEHQPLFPYLKYHLTVEELWKTFGDLKHRLSETIKKVASVEDHTTVVASNVLRLASQIAEALEIEIIKGISGICPLCKK